MRNLFGSGCTKGCFIYLLVLVMVIVVTAMGLSGLRARFGGGEVQGIRPQYAIQSVGQDQSQPPLADVQPLVPADTTAGGGGGGGGLPTPTPASLPPQPVSSPQPLQNTPTPLPTTQAQGGTISGEGTPPFYIVQPGDTLWDISRRFGVDLDALRAQNNITGDLIYPGQILYLPQPGQPQPAATTSPVPGAPHTGIGGDQGQGENASPDIPTMPHTGITKKP
jgi:LysM repeat protein